MDLASILSSRQKEITAEWIQKAQGLSGGHYESFPPDEITAWAEFALAQLIEVVRSGPNPKLDVYLKEISAARLEAGFGISELIEALLLSKEVCLPIIWEAYSTEPGQALTAIEELDRGLRYMLGRLGHLCAEAMTEQYTLETRARLAETESLQRTTSALLERLSLDEVLEIVCSEACRLTGASGSALLLLQEGDWLQVMISTGTPMPVLERLPVAGSLAGTVVRQGKPYLTNDPEHEIQAYHRNPHLKSLLVIPLRVNEIYTGVLDVVNKSGGFTEDDIRIMTLFATQAAVAIENARLHAQAENLAVLQERQRLARELHDSVTQSIYSVSLYADAARLALSAQKYTVTDENLQEVRNLAREAMLDMRLLIFELHPPILEQEGLVEALEARLESVEARAGVKTIFIVEGARRLPIAIETELYRIAAEAITNIVRHANAEEVRVQMTFRGTHFCLQVRDNGIGFDPEQVQQSGGMGLRGIEERVHQIGGSVIINSEPGSGTTIQVDLDL